MKKMLLPTGSFHESNAGNNYHKIERGKPINRRRNSYQTIVAPL